MPWQAVVPTYEQSSKAGTAVAMPASGLLMGIKSMVQPAVDFCILLIQKSTSDPGAYADEIEMMS